MPETLLRNCLDCQMLAETAHVDVLFTKWDMVEKEPKRQQNFEFVEFVETEFRKRFAGRVSSLRFAKVAAHSTEGTRPLGYGLTDLFVSWVERPVGAARCRVRSAELPANPCEYDRFRTTAERRLLLLRGAVP